MNKFLAERGTVEVKTKNAVITLFDELSNIEYEKVMKDKGESGESELALMRALFLQLVKSVSFKDEEVEKKDFKNFYDSISTIDSTKLTKIMTNITFGEKEEEEEKKS